MAPYFSDVIANGNRTVFLLPFLSGVLAIVKIVAKLLLEIILNAGLLSAELDSFLTIMALERGMVIELCFIGVTCTGIFEWSSIAVSVTSSRSLLIQSLITVQWTYI